MTAQNTAEIPRSYTDLFDLSLVDAAVDIALTVFVGNPFGIPRCLQLAQPLFGIEEAGLETSRVCR